MCKVESCICEEYVSDVGKNKKIKKTKNLNGAIKTFNTGMKLAAHHAAAAQKSMDMQLAAYQISAQSQLMEKLKQLNCDSLDMSAFVPLPHTQLQLAGFVPDSSAFAARTVGWA